jgi:PKD repeat protein
VSIQIVTPPTANSTWVSSPNNDIDFTNMSSNASSYFWDFGDGTTSTDINPSHTYATSGTWTVTLISSNAACSDTITFEVSSSLAELATIDWNVQLSPNPVSSILNISSIGDFTVAILDLSGKTVIEKRVYQQAALIDFSALQNGIYLVQLSNTNQQVVTKRVIKQ